MKERVHYIDNLRWITVFLLILYHACMAYNTWDEANYIFFVPDKMLSAVIVFISPWFMQAHQVFSPSRKEASQDSSRNVSPVSAFRSLSALS